MASSRLKHGPRASTDPTEKTITAVVMNWLSWKVLGSPAGLRQRWLDAILLGWVLYVSFVCSRLRR